MNNWKKLCCLFVFPLSVVLATGCGAAQYSLSLTGVRVAFDNNPTSIPCDQDFVTHAHPTAAGYLLDESKFAVTINDEEIYSSPTTWDYQNETFTLHKEAITGPVRVTATASKVDFLINYNYDSSLITPVGDFPTKTSDKDIDIRFALKNDYGVSANVTIGDKSSSNYNIRKVDNNVFSLLIESKYLTGNVNIALTATPGQLTINTSSINLINYDTYTINCYDSLGGNISYDAISTSAFTIDKIDNNTYRINSTSNNTCTDYQLVFRSSASTSYTAVKINVHHPKNVEEALNAVTLGYIRGNTSFKVTFEYNNSESFDSFASHLETIENMQGSYFRANYSTGENKENTFSIVGVPAHGHSYATDYSRHSNYLYPTVNCGNYTIRKSAITKRSGDAALPIDSLSRHIYVYNSEELFWAVEHGYIPLFSDPNSNASKIYNKARLWCLEEVNDSMNYFDKSRQLFDRLEMETKYDYYVASLDSYYPDWLKYPAYFLEGVFLNDGIAVCDGFSKAYALLGGIERLPIVRSSGFYKDEKGKTSGHAWNYVQIDGLYYLVCPTWAKAKMNRIEFDFYNRNFGLYNYDPFLTSKTYFKDTGDMDFSDDNFPYIQKESVPYCDNIYQLDKFTYNNRNCNFYVTSTDNLVCIFNKCYQLELSKTEFFVVFRVSDLKSFYDESSRSGWLINAWRNTSLRYNDSTAYWSNDGLVYVCFK